MQALRRSVVQHMLSRTVTRAHFSSPACMSGVAGVWAQPAHPQHTQSRATGLPCAPSAHPLPHMLLSGAKMPGVSHRMWSSASDVASPAPTLTPSLSMTPTTDSPARPSPLPNRADSLFGPETLDQLHEQSLDDGWGEGMDSDDEELPIKGSSLSIEVNMGNVELAARRLTRALVMEGVEDTMLKRRYFVKPAIQRVMREEDRERRHAKRSLKRKIKWFLLRRERGY